VSIAAWRVVRRRRAILVAAAALFALLLLRSGPAVGPVMHDFNPQLNRPCATVGCDGSLGGANFQP
jgi:hypothetical protein